ncbi:hypothetical protein T492DRAFT_930222, partial [Pavlovales sp. CCMP2436]
MAESSRNRKLHTRLDRATSPALYPTAPNGRQLCAGQQCHSFAPIHSRSSLTPNLQHHEIALDGVEVAHHVPRDVRLAVPPRGRPGEDERALGSPDADVALEAELLVARLRQQSNEQLRAFAPERAVVQPGRIVLRLLRDLIARVPRHASPHGPRVRRRGVLDL